MLSVIGFAQSSVNDVLATIDTSKIKVGEQTDIYLEATFLAGSDIVFPTLKDTLYGGIEIVEIKEIDTAYEADVKYKKLSDVARLASLVVVFTMPKPKSVLSLNPSESVSD